MAFKQPRVPEYRGEEGINAYIRTLVLFLKDFCTDAWTESREQKKAIGRVSQMLENIRTEIAEKGGADVTSTEGEE